MNYLNKNFGFSNIAAEALASSNTSRLPTVNPNENIQQLNISPIVDISNKLLTNNLQQPTNPSRRQSFQQIQRNNLYPNAVFTTTSVINSDVQYESEPATLDIINDQNTPQTNGLNYVAQENYNYGTPPSKRIKPNHSYNIEEHSTDINQTSKDPLRSSISRDSGCGSPPTINFAENEMNPILNPEEVTPIISHVTSTNPKAINIQSGNCVVCQRLRDWSFHQVICKNK
ncbi:unnamed protein product [Danaus chrysippus]|uniref:(African queen) hypothetical protein n=1 Tax=Danaus chrysippus TaxID=151541 RepID=A0A8J2VQQ4_9NEOP|nr:unnamed protein product [Danaus chrysippus]